MLQLMRLMPGMWLNIRGVPPSGDQRSTFNVELARMHPACLEYIVVHEMAHYFERSHGERCTRLMDDLTLDSRARPDQLSGTALAEGDVAVRRRDPETA